MSDQAIRGPAYPEVMTAVYRLYDGADQLLYLGVAEDFDTRFRQHARHKSWWPEVARKDVTWYADRLEAMYEEARAIAAEQPIHNRNGGLGSIGAAIVQRARAPRRGYSVPFRELVVSRHGVAAVLREVTEHPSFAVVTVNGRLAATLVPIDWYREARKARGEPTDL